MLVSDSRCSLADAIDAASSLNWRQWLTSKALPLWSSAGFDAQRTLYHERLTWDARPVAMEALRLMVQARQISTYCRAELDGFHDASSQALRCLDGVERTYHRGDDAPGWIFSLAPDGTPADCKRDLYAHAFILFAYGWAIRLTGEARYRRIARQTADEVEQIFTAPNKGYFDAVPTTNSMRGQNPHMHLLEAYLVLFEATGDDYYLDKLRALVALAQEHLLDKRSGLLLEFFDAEWSPAESAGNNRVEPGHLFEWSWLLSEYNRLAVPTTQNMELITQAAEHLFQIGLSRGKDPVTGLIYDAMTEDGVVFERTTRIWPQTEFLRLLCTRRSLGKNDSVLPHQLSEVFLARYTPPGLNGGWIDRFDDAGNPLVDYMPASSLYHIYGAARVLVTP